MHELPLCQAVLDSVLQRADGRAVRIVHVRIGTAHHATDEAFQQLFTQAAAGTLAKDASVMLTQIPATFSCTCGASGVVDARLPLCSACDEPVVPLGGDDLVVTAIEYAGT